MHDWTVAQGKPSTLPHARLALDDARLVIQELRELRIDDAEWRIRARWVAALAFLRLVGHVMHKVDEKSLSPRRAEVVRSWWKHMNDARLPEYSIFHDFIEEERNNIVKEYDFRFPWRRRALTFNGAPLTFNGSPLTFGGAFTVVDGPLKGRDALELCELGLAWWEDKGVMLEAQIDVATA